MGCHHTFGGAKFEDGARAEMPLEDAGVVVAGAGGDSGQVPGIPGDVFEAMMFGGVGHDVMKGIGLGGGRKRMEREPSRRSLSLGLMRGLSKHASRLSIFKP
jgi:hypothetical protein